MPSVTGQFDVTLATPITIWPEVKQADLLTCEFQINEDAKVRLDPLTITPLVDYGVHYGEPIYDFPQLTEIRVTVVRDVQITHDSDGHQIIPHEEEEQFEPILLDAVRRFVTAVKVKMSEWSLDTRHPVHAYSSKYFYQNMSLDTVWPRHGDSKKLPDYFLWTLTTSTEDFTRELTADIWAKVADDCQNPVPFPAYEELLFDARVFRSSMRYDVAALFAGIAAEVMLEEVCGKLLHTKGSFTDDQINEIIGNRGMKQLADLVSTLEPSLKAIEKELNGLPRLRNKIAHGEKRTTTGKEATDEIQIAQGLKRQLAAWL